MGLAVACGGDGTVSRSMGRKVRRRGYRHGPVAAVLHDYRRRTGKRRLNPLAEIMPTEEIDSIIGGMHAFAKDSSTLVGMLRIVQM
jgi:hypothetical protein